jgi:hypothetical protein
MRPHHPPILGTPCLKIYRQKSLNCQKKKSAACGGSPRFTTTVVSERTPCTHVTSTSTWPASNTVSYYVFTKWCSPRGACASDSVCPRSVNIHPTQLPHTVSQPVIEAARTSERGSSIVPRAVKSSCAGPSLARARRDRRTPRARARAAPANPTSHRTHRSHARHLRAAIVHRQCGCKP